MLTMHPPAPVSKQTQNAAQPICAVNHPDYNKHFPSASAQPCTSCSFKVQSAPCISKLHWNQRDPFCWIQRALTQAIKCTRHVGFCCIFFPILKCNLLTHPKCCIKCRFLSIKPQIPMGFAPNWCFSWTYCSSFHVVTPRGESSLPTSKNIFWVLYDIEVLPRKQRLNFCPQIYTLSARALMLSSAHKLLFPHTQTHRCSLTLTG